MMTAEHPFPQFASNYPRHLRPRDGESKSDWLDRTARSCYWCPREFPNAHQADAHEIQCDRLPREDRYQG